VAHLSFLAQNLDFHDQLTDAPVGIHELPLHGIVLALLEAGVDARQGAVAPTFELVYRHRDFARDGVHRLAAQQAQHDFLLAPRRPPLHLGGRAGRASSRSTRSFQRARRNPFHLRFIQRFTAPFSDTI